MVVGGGHPVTRLNACHQLNHSKNVVVLVEYAMAGPTRGSGADLYPFSAILPDKHPSTASAPRTGFFHFSITLLP